MIHITDWAFQIPAKQRSSYLVKEDFWSDMNISQQTLGNSPTSSSILIALRSDVQIYTQVAALVLICAGTVVGNIFVVGVVICNYRLHYPTYYFICSLASADFLVGAFYIPLFIASTLAQKWQLPVTLCNWHAAFISLSFNASLITLCLVSVDRFLAITDPLRWALVHDFLII